MTPQTPATVPPFTAALLALMHRRTLDESRAAGLCSLFLRFHGRDAHPHVRRGRRGTRVQFKEEEVVGGHGRGRAVTAARQRPPAGDDGGVEEDGAGGRPGVIKPHRVPRAGVAPQVAVHVAWRNG